MKKLLVIFSAVASLLFAGSVTDLRADNVRGIYDRYASVSGAESVSLGRFWINLAKLVVAFGTEEDSLASEDARLAINTLSHLDAVRVLDLSGCDPETIAKFNADVDSVEVAGYELLTRMKDGEDDMRILIRRDGDVIDELLLLCAGAEAAIIQLEGSITMDEAAGFVSEITEVSGQ